MRLHDEPTTASVRKIRLVLSATFIMSMIMSSIVKAEPQSPAIAVEAARRVEDSIATTMKRLATLPPSASDAERLLRMGQLDQAAREPLSQIDFSAMSETQKKAAWELIGAQMRTVDEANMQELLTMIPPEGWFPTSRYGLEAARAAFMIVQHSKPEFWRRFLPAIERLVKSGEAEAPAYALMYDRLALSEGRPQRYGSQMECRGDQYVPQRTR